MRMSEYIIETARKKYAVSIDRKERFTDKEVEYEKLFCGDCLVTIRKVGE